jgi:hypothetical protein
VDGASTVTRKTEELIAQGNGRFSGCVEDLHGDRSCSLCSSGDVGMGVDGGQAVERLVVTILSCSSATRGRLYGEREEKSTIPLTLLQFSLPQQVNQHKRQLDES